MLNICHIHKHYGSKIVLNDISFEAGPGKCVGILGENGCGKSTLLSILAGITKCSSGSLQYNDTDLLSNHRLLSKIIGYVPQGIPLISELNALDNLRLWYDNKDHLRYELESGVLALLGIPDFLKLPVAKMSGGMKKRLCIGCAIASDPCVLLLDEPSAALDLICKERIFNYLSAFKDNGGTIIIATHDIQEFPLCDSFFILKNGQLVSYTYDGNVHHLVGSL